MSIPSWLRLLSCCVPGSNLSLSLSLSLPPACLFARVLMHSPSNNNNNNNNNNDRVPTKAQLEGMTLDDFAARL